MFEDTAAQRSAFGAPASGRQTRPAGVAGVWAAAPDDCLTVVLGGRPHRRADGVLEIASRTRAPIGTYGLQPVAERHDIMGRARPAGGARGTPMATPVTHVGGSLPPRRDVSACDRERRRAFGNDSSMGR